MKRVTVAAVIILFLVVGVGAVTYIEFGTTPSPCGQIKPGTFVKSQISKVTFGAVTEYPLPSQGRWPNAVTTATDGSVWFAEEEVPGVAHLYPNNGTLVEYAWEGYPTPKAPDCLYAASSSGIALWDGRVWAADEFSNSILGVDPGDGSMVRVNTTSEAAYPYWLAVGPDGNLWFTSDNYPGALGRVFPNMTLSVVKLEGVGNDEPIQLVFVNSSLAFFSAVNEAENATTKACICTGHVYSFDPSGVSTHVKPSVVGGSYTLVLPTSVSFSQGKIWVAQHGPSSVVTYDFTTGKWTKYPTSLVPWSSTLPLVIIADGSRVWFNEHYANKIGILDAAAGTLTEVSESNPPATSATGIQNDESIALADGGLWFTSETGNYLGYVDGSYAGDFGISVADSNRSVTVAAGKSVTVSIAVEGAWSSPLSVNSSDSEGYGSVPKLIHVETGGTSVPVGTRFTLSVKISLEPSVAPGRYVVAVTFSGEGIQKSAYIYVDAV